MTHFEASQPLPPYTLGNTEDQEVPIFAVKNGKKVQIGTGKVRLEGDRVVMSGDITDPDMMKVISASAGDFSIGRGEASYIPEVEDASERYHFGTVRLTKLDLPRLDKLYRDLNMEPLWMGSETRQRLMLGEEVINGPATPQGRG